MRLLRLRAADFRNIGFAEVDLAGPRHFLLGANGQGKTNLLEAVGMLNALRSFRTRDVRTLLRHGAKSARLRFEVEHERDGVTTVEMEFGAETKSVLVDGEPVRRFEDFVGRFPAAVFCSDDIALLRGSPPIAGAGSTWRSRRRIPDISPRSAVTTARSPAGTGC